MTLALLYYYRLDGTVEAEPLNYKQIEAEFLRKAPNRDGKPLDAAIITVGERAPVLERLARSEACYLIDLPEVEALCRKYVFFYPHEIPQGLYSRNPLKIPEKRVHTVAAGAQLLSREGVSTSLVEEVTRIVLNKKFATENGLGELFHGEREFARRQPSFPVHMGATNIYEPDLRPPLNADFVESLAGMQSFFFAVVIAIFLGIRWLVRRRARRQEHKLDRFMKKLLVLEANQIPLDSRGGSDDIEVLNGLLDQVTMLRQEVLRDITAHEVTEDRAVECFINMCHALSNKINAKITRQRFDRCFAGAGNQNRSIGREKKNKPRNRTRPKRVKKRSLRG